jgi:toluene monooxygenase system protein E
MTTTTRRTYWHLEGARKKPSEYDITTSRLLYHPARGLEVTTPAGRFLLERQHSSTLVARDWDAFVDPRETTYAKYVREQEAKEIFVDGLFRAEGAPKPSAEWLVLLDRLLGPLRFPIHGLQMAAAYVGHAAPSGRIVIACAFQAADEARRIQRIAYRMRQLMDVSRDFGAKSRDAWEREPMWQPLRRCVEELLVTYEWGEAFVALNLVVKPKIDSLFTTRFARLAASSRDDVLAKTLSSLEEDHRWHREWTSALVQMCIADDASNEARIQSIVERWTPRADDAIARFASIIGEPS